MASATDRQLAKCVEIRTYTDSQGEVRRSGVFLLDDDPTKEFDVPETRHLKLEKDKFYYPRLIVGEKALVSKRTGNAYISKFVTATWHEVK